MSKDNNHSDGSYGPSGEIRRLKQNGNATASELREFMSSLQGKRPQEVLGLVAQSSLTRGLVESTMIVIVLVAAGTVVPYLAFPKQEAVAQQPAENATDGADTEGTEGEDGSTDQPAAADNAAATDPTAPAAGGTKEQPDIIERLGIGEVKNGEPGVNPLDGGGDDLLKDLD